eukprot:2484465-Pyramimonas_sp.AAC.5
MFEHVDVTGNKNGLLWMALRSLGWQYRRHPGAGIYSRGARVQGSLISLNGGGAHELLAFGTIFHPGGPPGARWGGSGHRRPRHQKLSITSAGTITALQTARQLPMSGMARR